MNVKKERGFAPFFMPAWQTQPLVAVKNTHSVNKN
jgi:hypothetical protein